MPDIIKHFREENLISQKCYTKAEEIFKEFKDLGYENSTIKIIISGHDKGYLTLGFSKGPSYVEATVDNFGRYMSTDLSFLAIDDFSCSW